MSKLTIQFCMLASLPVATAYISAWPTAFDGFSSVPLRHGRSEASWARHALASLHSSGLVLDALYNQAWPLDHHLMSPRYRSWPSYVESLDPRLSTMPPLAKLERLYLKESTRQLEDLLATRQASQQARRAEKAAMGTRWVDKGETVDAAFALPPAFNVDGSASLSAELDAETNKLTVHGSRTGMRFSRSLLLPFPKLGESDVELEHDPRAGQLTLRLRKPADAPPAPPTALPIKRIEVDVPAPPAEADGGKERAAPAEARERNTAEQELEKKFGFVKQADQAADATPADDHGADATLADEGAAIAADEAAAMPSEEAAAMPSQEAPKAAAGE